MINQKNIAGIISELKFVTIVLAITMVFRTTAFGMYHIPSESMLPTLAVGDRVGVNKFAYGYSRHSLPFSAAPSFPGENGRIFGKTPDRGDIAVFKHPRTGEAYIKRVVGLPGDLIEIREGRLYVNQQRIDRSAIEDRRYKQHKSEIAKVRLFHEYLNADNAHKIYERSDHYFGDNIGPLRVPSDSLFVLGDNRDNSLDSRYMTRGVGFLPIENLVGKAIGIAFSTHQCRPKPGLTCHNRPWLSGI